MYELEVNEENIKQTIASDVLGRNGSIFNFLVIILFFISFYSVKAENINSVNHNFMVLVTSIVSILIVSIGGSIILFKKYNKK